MLICALSWGKKWPDYVFNFDYCSSAHSPPAYLISTRTNATQSRHFVSIDARVPTSAHADLATFTP